MEVVEAVKENVKANGEALTDAMEVAESVAAVAAVAEGAAVAVATQAARAAGEGLLVVAEKLPFIAPVAFLVGAIVKAADDATSLKEDAAVFANVVVSVEGILVQAATKGALEKAEDAVAELREALEEGHAHCLRLSRRGLVEGMLLSLKDADDFQDITERVDRAMQLITLAASVEAASIAKAQYNQTQELRAAVDELGGAAAVADDPEKLALVKGKLQVGSTGYFHFS